jgi:hypothetical protein
VRLCSVFEKEKKKERHIVRGVIHGLYAYLKMLLFRHDRRLCLFLHTVRQSIDYPHRGPEDQD